MRHLDQSCRILPCFSDFYFVLVDLCLFLMCRKCDLVHFLWVCALRVQNQSVIIFVSFYLHFINLTWMVVGLRQRHDPLTGRRKDAPPSGPVKLFEENPHSLITGGIVCFGKGGNGRGASRHNPTFFPTHPKKRVGGRLVVAKMLPPVLTTFVTWGSVGMAPRPRAHAPRLLRVYSPSLCLKRQPAKQQG